MTIKKIEIKNMFGIRKYEANFLLKNIPSDSDLEDQVIKLEDEFYSLIPSFLAKNAAGKTSFVKAINFSLRFGEKNSFVEELAFYIKKIYQEINNNYKNIEDNTNENYLGDQYNNYGIILTSTLFKQISFSGSRYLYVNILTDEGDIKIEMTPESFFVVINNNNIDVVNLINNFDFNSIKNNTFLESKNKIKKFIKSWIDNKGYKFYEYKTDSIFRGDKPATKINELLIKNKTTIHLNKLIEYLGESAIKVLIKKIDKNIDNISKDSDSKNIDIYSKWNPNFTISPSNLSFGTQKVLEILYKSIPIFEKGGIMMIDEIENGLHLSLISLIVSIFTNNKINKKKGQILFTTHNPLIFKRGIVDSYNIFMEENFNFINIADSKAVNRTEDKIKSITPKNYYSDIYWSSMGVDDKTTVSDYSISQIVESMEKGLKCQQRE